MRNRNLPCTYQLTAFGYANFRIKLPWPCHSLCKKILVICLKTINSQVQMRVVKTRQTQYFRSEIGPCLGLCDNQYFGPRNAIITTIGIQFAKIFLAKWHY